MTLKKLLLFPLILLLAAGCASPGPKFIDLSYTGDQVPDQSARIGIADFVDNRRKTQKGWVGHRILVDKSQETYLVRGMDLGATLTRHTQTFLEKKGFTLIPIPSFAPTLAGMATAPEGLDHVLSAHINTFECRATKKGTTTHMILEIDLRFLLGTREKKKFSIIPVALTLERTELTFTPEKLQDFINQALEEILEKALIFE